MSERTPLHQPAIDKQMPDSHSGKLIAGITLVATLAWWCAGRGKKKSRQDLPTTLLPSPSPRNPPPAIAASTNATSHNTQPQQPPLLEYDWGKQLASVLGTLMPILLAWQRRQLERKQMHRQAQAPKVALDSLQQNASLDLLPPSTPEVTPEHGPEVATAPAVTLIRGGRWYQQAWQFASAAVNAWLENFAPSMGAAIAYYTIFSIAPILVIAIAVAGMIFGHDAAQGEIVEQIRSIVGSEGAIAVQALLRSVSTRSDGIIATVLSVITLVVGATAVFAELQSALDRIWRIPVAARSRGLWSLLRTRLLSFGLILGLGFMLMVSLVVSAALAALGKWWGGWFEGWAIVIQLLNFVISFLVFTALFSAIYKFMPRVHLSWHDVRIGAVATAVLFIIGKYLIGIYLGKTGMSSGFGAAGSFALLLAWIYYSAQIFLLGAEFTWIYAHNFGSRRRLRAPVSGTLPAAH